ncbi:MAG: hypothetical protein A2504_02415 [Bdellovibrionales bacterium RIFOXYD12_FULL_39_22]|nr:MAG: hypothetical protein A2385_12445 [Bdellovibrionales bacterium RIFOXYB1_FULL_39_21]OFZ41158.1 MAG: hypothetical protein A2485_00855 [Bdellovibrionales bacterium RIFOXYC12_FULL_39_17]OFZ44912.1 MAG: hypothetical protein A2404_11600 [Bdellovibrionales bacterium RIFOXYC1_FULL_39_130]OFZ74359.1 MAG: hypothetical protein A2560_11970 [Bdellovibrionales bacterium RIFOXYD1_FULL_39_84]OFZ92361.1 MAG: hypothetical protein A2504_02415 [Bdellovibrionales bacterium RIFOXYD12_FULL_39_22]HLE10688.1 hy
MRFNRNIFLFFFVFILNFISYTLGFATDYYGEVVAIKGVATYGQRVLVLGDKIPYSGSIGTDVDSIIKIYLPADETFLVIGPLSLLSINSPAISLEKTAENLQNFTLVRGSARWISPQREFISQRLIVVQAGPGYVGGKSSDFVVVSSPMFEEMELIVINGKALLRSNAIKKDQVLATSLAWAGLGGRFGLEVSGPLLLSANVLDHYKKLDIALLPGP